MSYLPLVCVYVQVRMKQKRRKNVIAELLQTEHTYIGKLRNCLSFLKPIPTNALGHLNAVESKYRIPLKTTTVQDFQFSPVSTPVDKGIPEYKSSPGSSSTPSSQHRSRDTCFFLNGRLGFADFFFFFFK